MTLRRFAFLAGAIMALSTVTAQAQWSIGAPGTREAPKGQHRYAMLVMIDPLPGKELVFNDFYQNTHQGDLVQLPGWTGSQRFRWLPEVKPRNITQPFIRGNLIIWDQEGEDLSKVAIPAGVIGGKSRIIDGFDYTAGASTGGTYEVVGPRMDRPDGKKAFMPPASDIKTPRPNRYIMMDYYDPAAGVSDAVFEASLKSRIPEYLAIPGFMHAQLFRTTATAPPPANSARLSLPKYLVIWEGEASALNDVPQSYKGAQVLQDALTAATKSGQVKAVSENTATRQSTWWVPIAPWINKSNFDR